VATITASMFLPSLSSIWRKSRNFGAFSKRWNVVAARRSSTSHSATMFSVGAAAERFEAPWPPEPMAAKFSFSLGDLYPADFNDGVLPNPAAGRAPANRLP
jgi:hypothetical protein